MMAPPPVSTADSILCHLPAVLLIVHGRHPDSTLLRMVAPFDVQFLGLICGVPFSYTSPISLPPISAFVIDRQRGRRLQACVAAWINPPAYP